MSVKEVAPAQEVLHRGLGETPGLVSRKQAFNPV
jgi:hypothetical protein